MGEFFRVARTAAGTFSAQSKNRTDPASAPQPDLNSDLPNCFDLSGEDDDGDRSESSHSCGGTGRGTYRGGKWLACLLAEAFAATLSTTDTLRTFDVYVWKDNDNGNDRDTGEQERHVVVKVLKIEITSLGFTGDHDITDWPTGNAIGKDAAGNDLPVWTSAGTNDPISYTKNTAPSMFAVFAVSPNVSPNISGVRVRSLVGTTTIAQASNLTISSATINDNSNTDGDVDNISSASAIPNSNAVNTVTPTIAWEYSLDNGTTWITIGSTGPHSFHFTEATPLESSLYDEALQRACGYVAANSNSENRITTGIDGDITYDPGVNVPGHPLNLYSSPVGGQCSNHAALMRVLLRSIGIDASVTYLWGGCAAANIDYFRLGAWWGPSFRVILAAHDSAPVDPHYTFHAVTSVTAVSGAVNHFDPSYGTMGIITLNETAPAGSAYWDFGVAPPVLRPTHPAAATRQTGSSYPPANIHRVDWSCPH